MKETTEDKVQRLALIKDGMLNAMPVNKLLGVVLESIEEGHVEVRVPFQKAFVGDFRRGLWHGGILASIADTLGGIVAFSLAHLNDQINTVDMRIDYLHGAKEEDIYGTGVLVKSGKRIILVDVKLFQKHQEEPVAVARCAYSILRK
jgi:uncharacterized protein (TIGR00369 family)